MALINVTAKSISGRKLVGSTQSIVVNSENMYGWKTVGADSTFFYVLNPNDRREKAIVITIDETVATMLSAANAAFGDKIVKIPTVTAVGGAVTDIYIPVKSITWAEQHAAETDYVKLRYNEGGFRTREVLVPFSLNDIEFVGSTGTSSS